MHPGVLHAQEQKISAYIAHQLGKDKSAAEHQEDTQCLEHRVVKCMESGSNICRWTSIQGSTTDHPEFNHLRNWSKIAAAFAGKDGDRLPYILQSYVIEHFEPLLPEHPDGYRTDIRKIMMSKLQQSSQSTFQEKNGGSDYIGRLAMFVFDARNAQLFVERCEVYDQKQGTKETLKDKAPLLHEYLSKEQLGTLNIDAFFSVWENSAFIETIDLIGKKYSSADTLVLLILMAAIDAHPDVRPQFLADAKLIIEEKDQSEAKFRVANIGAKAISKVTYGLAMNTYTNHYCLSEKKKKIFHEIMFWGTQDRFQETAAKPIIEILKNSQEIGIKAKAREYANYIRAVLGAPVWQREEYIKAPLLMQDEPIIVFREALSALKLSHELGVDHIIYVLHEVSNALKEKSEKRKIRKIREIKAKMEVQAREFNALIRYVCKH